MGINDVEFDSAKFSEVWDRVMPDSGEKTDEASRLRGFMDMEAEAVRHVMAISERCCRHISAELCDIAECDLRHVEALHARYYILTGERHTPPKLCPVVNTELEALRSLYITKMQLTEEYRSMSSSNSFYTKLAEQEACTADEIYKIIIKLLNR